MQIDLTVEELELVLIVLKAHVKDRRATGLPSTQAEGLIARLEQQERDAHRAARQNP